MWSMQSARAKHWIMQTDSPRNWTKARLGLRRLCAKEANMHRWSNSTPEDRFWAKVDKNGPIPDHCPGLGPCWIWIGTKSDNGYGLSFYFGSRPATRAHRVAWFLYHRSLPTYLVLHRCDNPLCVKDTHLFEGTHADNMADMRSKNRQPVYIEWLTRKLSRKLSE
jgi:HNH endonuclease